MAIINMQAFENVCQDIRRNIGDRFLYSPGLFLISVLLMTDYLIVLMMIVLLSFYSPFRVSFIYLPYSLLHVVPIKVISSLSFQHLLLAALISLVTSLVVS